MTQQGLQANRRRSVEWERLRAVAAGVALSPAAVSREATLRQLAIEVTNRCNMRCKMCVAHGAGLYQGQADGHPPFIDVELFKSIVDQYARLRSLGPKTVSPQFQGEPLLHPQFLELCEYLERRQINFGFTTNGSLLTPDKAKALLAMRHFRSVAFSIDGLTQETYENIRRGGKYEQVMANVEAFLALPKPSYFTTAISFTIQPDNETEQAAFLRQWVPKVNYVSMNNVAQAGRPVRLDWTPSRIPCQDLWQYMVVLTNGQVVPCCRDYLYELEMGNLACESLEQVWYGERYGLLRVLHTAAMWDHVPLCRQCDTWMCHSTERKIEFQEPNVRIERGPFFRVASALPTRLLRHEVVPFEQYHPLEKQPPPTALPKAEQRRKILVLAYVYPFNAATILDHCASLGKYSRHEVFYYNPVFREKPAWLDLDSFDAIVLHYSISIIADYYLKPSWLGALRATRALKVLFIQDEYRKVDEHVARMQELGIEVLFTCVPCGEVSKVYPPEKFPWTKIFCTLTGFVPEYLSRQPPDFSRPRPIDVGYRARTLGYWYGELGQEKRIIGERFAALAAGRGLICDISCREEDRLYGRRWVRFLRSCRCVLGSESGASVFDFTGQIEAQTKAYLASHPHATFAEVRERFFKHEEGRIRLNQISPRIFEAIACGAGLVLFEGEYSGIIQPYRHFIPLKKDFSNFEEVLAKIKDEKYVQNMARRAYEEIILPGRYSYQRFAEGFDRALEMVFAEKNALGLAEKPPPGAVLKASAGEEHGHQPIVAPTDSVADENSNLAAMPQAQHRGALGRYLRLLGRAAGIAGRMLRRSGIKAARHLRHGAGVLRAWWWQCYYTVKNRILRFLTDWQPLYRRSYFRLLWHAIRRKLQDS